MENSYYSKYLKYKNKYLSLKNEKVGGSSATSGSTGPEKKENGEVVKGIDGNFYSPIESGDKFLKQIAGPSSVGVRPNLAEPTKPGQVVVRVCKHGVTDSTSQVDPKPDYYKYLEAVDFKYEGTEKAKMEALEKKFKEDEKGAIAKGNATEDDLALVKDIIAKVNHEDFGSEEDEAGVKATEEFNKLELCAENRKPQDL